MSVRFCLSDPVYKSTHNGMSGHRFLLVLQVSSRPLKVAVEHLKDLPYSSSDDIVKATYMEVVATLKDLLAQHPIYREQLQSSFQFGSDFQDLSRLTDMAAALTSAQDTALQAVLSELSVPDRYNMLFNDYPPTLLPMK